MLITVFTPTYNRAYTLGRLYESLRAQQGCKFEWIIVDDGSTDDTEGLVAEWRKSSLDDFSIRYFKQVNSGKHVAWNKGLKEAEGSIFFPVDSDDYLTPFALRSIVGMVETVSPEDDKIIAVSGTRCFPGNKLTGGILQSTTARFIDYSSIDRRYKGIEGDLAEAFFTEKLREYPFPVYVDEKFVPEAVIFNRFSNDGLLIRGFRDPLYCCEYLEDGYTKNTDRLLIRNWKGYCLYVRELMKSPTSIRAKVVPFCGYCYRALLKLLGIVR